MWYLILLVLVSLFLVLFALSEKTYNFAMSSLKTLAIICISSMLLAVALYGIGAVAKAEEIRSVCIIEFDLSHGEAIVEDEDGYTWRFTFGDHSWIIGQELDMVLPDDGEPYLIWSEKENNN